MSIVFGYWGIRGRGQLARYILEYTEQEYTEKRYSNPQDWFGKDKPELKTPYPNLPYITDGDFSLSESNALINYIVRKSG